MIFNIDKIRSSLKSRLQVLWVKIYPTLQSLDQQCRPHLIKVWSRIEAVAERMFELSDHTKLRKPRILLRILAFFLLLILLWAVFFKVDQVVHAQGQVVASAHTQIVQAADGGVLTEMRVVEGDRVELGQVIAVLEKERALAAFSESSLKVMALRMNLQRLQAEVSQTDLNYEDAIKKEYPALFETQMNLYRQRTRAIQDQLIVLKDNVKLASQELTMNEPLEKFGDISKVDVLRLKRAVNEAQNFYVSAKNKYLQDASAELNKAQEDLNAQEQVLSDRKQLLDHTNIVSPSTGIVKSVRVTTLGGVLRQGDELLQILPTNSDLVIEAKVKPADIAEVRIGMPAKVKLDAYDYAIFGTMSGIVSYVSADSLIEDSKAGPINYYRVKVSISGKDLKKRNQTHDIEIRPGMTASVDLKSGHRSIFSFLVKPITKTFSESFGER